MGMNSINILPWKVGQQGASQSIKNSQSRKEAHSDHKNGSTVNMKNGKDNPLFTMGSTSLGQKTLESQLPNSRETWTKETVDAAVALTNMAGLNTQRYATLSPKNLV